MRPFLIALLLLCTSAIAFAQDSIPQREYPRYAGVWFHLGYNGIAPSPGIGLRAWRFGCYIFFDDDSAGIEDGSVPPEAKYTETERIISPFGFVFSGFQNISSWAGLHAGIGIRFGKKETIANSDYGGRKYKLRAESVPVALIYDLGLQFYPYKLLMVGGGFNTHRGPYIQIGVTH